MNSRERYTEILIAIAIILIAFSLYRLGGIYGLDGGMSTVGAERILAGEIPYRDFWTIYAPGHFYLLALFFRIFGAHLMVEFVAASIVTSVATWLTYRLVFNLIGARVPALACAAIFFAAMYDTGYFKSLNTYPPTSFFILVTLNLVFSYYKTTRGRDLIAAGLATGAVATFKHDVGAYTAIAVIAGLITYHLLLPTAIRDQMRLLIQSLGTYSLASVAIVLPWVMYFAIFAGPEMWQDIFVFPLTDFRFARPEGYPSLLPFDILVGSRFQTFVNLVYYLIFATPFLVFLFGLAAVVWAIRIRKLEYAALGVTFSIGFLLHYFVAHVQINTHIVSMSFYSAALGAVLYTLMRREFRGRRLMFLRLVGLGLALGWLLSLAGKPIYLVRENSKFANIDVQIAKISGFRVAAEEARNLEELTTFVSAHVPSGQYVFVGNHRHDVVVISDALMYFIVDRASATRYHELHPAIADTSRVQLEMIRDLERQRVSTLILKNIFSDEVLESVKRDFLEHLPNVGANDLDRYIRANYESVRQFGPYIVWQRRTDFSSARAIQFPASSSIE